MTHGEPRDEPLAELAELREEPDAGFLLRVRRSIHRRLTAADTLDFALAGIFLAVLD